MHDIIIYLYITFYSAVHYTQLGEFDPQR